MELATLQEQRVCDVLLRDLDVCLGLAGVLGRANRNLQRPSGSNGNGVSRNEGEHKVKGGVSGGRKSVVVQHMSPGSRAQSWRILQDDLLHHGLCWAVPLYCSGLSVPGHMHVVLTGTKLLS